MTKIAVSCVGRTLDDLVDPRFGRAANFMIVDTDTLEFEAVDNSAGRVQAQGAGIQAGETVADFGVEAVLSGFVGPKAFQALQAAGVKVVQGLENISVRQAVEEYKSGRVVATSAPMGSPGKGGGGRGGGGGGRGMGGGRGGGGR
jgi:predicted Fe-Mo cluster-binding NifX family protein